MSGTTELNISVSLIDYIGIMDNGVAVILSMFLEGITYEMVYWFDRDNKRRLKIEDKFYQDYPLLRDIMEYKYLIDLYYHIDTNILPKREIIYNEFNLQ